MNRKFASPVSAFARLVIFSWIALGTGASAQTAPVIFTVTPKPVTGQLQIGDQSRFAVHGRASLTVTAANENDTLTGILIYAIPDDARQKIAQMSGRSLSDVPASVPVKNVTANFRRGTACPLLRIEVSVKEIEVVGIKLVFDRIELDIRETPAQINQLFCSWARQINANRQRLGIISAINRLITAQD